MEPAAPSEAPVTSEAPAIIPASDFTSMAAEESPSSRSATAQTGHAYVGSSESERAAYHYPSCRWAKNILPENLIGWDTVEDAQAAGYSPCGTCNPH